ncbi:hypothetical protein D9M72_598920 [compost metagenome]
MLQCTISTMILSSSNATGSPGAAIARSTTISRRPQGSTFDSSRKRMKPRHSAPRCSCSDGEYTRIDWLDWGSAASGAPPSVTRAVVMALSSSPSLAWCSNCRPCVARLRPSSHCRASRISSASKPCALSLRPSCSGSGQASPRQ